MIPVPLSGTSNPANCCMRPDPDGQPATDRRSQRFTGSVTENANTGSIFPATSFVIPPPTISPAIKRPPSHYRSAPASRVTAQPHAAAACCALCGIRCAHIRNAAENCSRQSSAAFTNAAGGAAPAESPALGAGAGNLHKQQFRN